MTTIKQNLLRVGNFTSSRAVALFSVGTRRMTEEELATWKRAFPKSKKLNIDDGWGEAALTYIDEKNMERRLGRSLSDETKSRPTSWGTLVERRVFDLLPTDYKYNSDDTVQHPKIPFWVGTPEGNKLDKGKTVYDIKCPLTLKSFCTFADCENMDQVRLNHADGEKYYWQLVSNAVLTDSKFAELIVYMPYLSELESLRELASEYIGNPNKVAWIGFAEDDELPFLPDKGYYENLITFRFEVPDADKKRLENKIVEAGKLLIQPPFKPVFNGMRI